MRYYVSLVSVAECPDDVVNRFIVDATETVEVEGRKTLRNSDLARYLMLDQGN